MFVIDDILLAAAIGGGLGAVTNRKDPLKGALMGAALGGVGGGLLGAGAGAGMSAANTAPGMLAAQEAGLGSSALGWGGATTGIQGTMNSALGSQAGSNIGGLLGNAKPVMNIASQGIQAANMFKQPEQPLLTPPQVPIPVGGPQALSQLSANLGQQGVMTDQQRMLEEQRRRELLSRLGGGYGRSFG